ncbi:MAG: hypothetical protein A2233_01165 [Candidatus Kerfeldbacteria bacterium RIFOXYA2_FULL_38_24]|uniref:DUF805 domain-containing protein n=1 Tax=Candidatus Kerfeldbacteria bacterium RIFOXYB2_FULL_38_14 TaxID=1798547 RepID=A0A1G2BEC1_9BACT|nr:MAG: hypothetical protein A2233_01165 [Candidatus Kerfeldbacteria bacterium RIFOXYA2_FULL_38_24]OGY86547.1 MAG: hypothetical protein A2319_02155 [Candidatus Kerfeldbacteria bacterium RIFOXYB2_FULL_38_14]
MNYYIEVLKKYAVFSGRASRKEYWMFVLFNLIIIVALSIVESILNSNGILGGLYSLAVLLPGLGAAIRRLHDIDRTGWWLLISLIPVLGFIVLIVFLATAGNSGDNKYGQKPKDLEPKSTN